MQRTNEGGNAANLIVDRPVGPNGRPRTSNPGGIACARKARCNATMGTKSREAIWGGQILGAKIRARGAREAAQKAAREADRAEAYAWSVQWKATAGQHSHRQRSGNASTAGLGGWMWNATAARRERACRSTPSAGRETRQSGSSGPR